MGRRSEQDGEEWSSSAFVDEAEKRSRQALVVGREEAERFAANVFPRHKLLEAEILRQARSIFEAAERTLKERSTIPGRSKDVWQALPLDRERHFVQLPLHDRVLTT